MFNTFNKQKGLLSLCLICVKFSCRQPELDETPTPFSPSSFCTVTIPPSHPSEVTNQKSPKAVRAALTQEQLRGGGVG